MPPLETMDRNQKAVLWEFTGYDANGQVLVGEPTELDVRWTWGDSRTLDPQGNLISVAAQVVVDREVSIGSLMREGSLSDWLGTGSDDGNDMSLMEVSTYKTATDIKHRDRRYRLGLTRYKGSLPVAAT